MTFYNKGNPWTSMFHIHMLNMMEENMWMGDDENSSDLSVIQGWIMIDIGDEQSRIGMTIKIFIAFDSQYAQCLHRQRS